MEKVTVSLIKADVGSYPGHSLVHPALLEVANEEMSSARDAGTIVDFKVLHAGDDLELLMSHRMGVDNPDIHELAWNTFMKATRIAKNLKFMVRDRICSRMLSLEM